MYSFTYTYRALSILALVGCLKLVSSETCSSLNTWIESAKFEAKCHSNEEFHDQTVFSTLQCTNNKLCKECHQQYLQVMQKFMEMNRNLNDVCKCEPELDSATGKDSGSSAIETDCVSSHFNIHQPELLCRNSNSLKLHWNVTNVENIRVIYLVERTCDSNFTVWEPVITVRKNVAVIRNLASDQSYKVRVRAIGADGQLGKPVISEEFSTLAGCNKQRMPVKNVSSTILQAYEHVYTAQITWEPASDMNCEYVIRVLNIEVNNKRNHRKFYVNENNNTYSILTNVSYDMQISYYVSALVDGCESDARGNYFEYNCLEALGHNYSLCVPPKPKFVWTRQKLSSKVAKNGSKLYDVSVFWVWKFPENPDYFAVKVLFAPDDYERYLLYSNVSGENTSVVLKGIYVGKYEYSVLVRACSKVGCGQGEWNRGNEYKPSYMTTDNNTDDTSKCTHEIDTMKHSNQNTVLYIVVPIAAGVLFFSILYIVFSIKTGKRIFPKMSTAQPNEAGNDMWYNTIQGFQSTMKKSVQNFPATSYIEVNNDDQTHKPLLKLNYNLMDVEMETDIKFDQWEISGKYLALQEKIGEGEFGVVHKGLLQDRYTGHLQKVAVKKLKANHSDTDLKEFKEEINLMKSVGKHPNIVSIVGWCSDLAHLCLIVEYCEYGNLLNFLKERAQSALYENDSVYLKYDISCNPAYFEPAETLLGNQRGFITKDKVKIFHMLSFARQIAVGMEYLSINRVVHRDLAARNVLVSSPTMVKISDFGMSRAVYDENIYCRKGKGKLPVKWMAIESLVYELYTTKSDVWSYGILLWEILTMGDDPYPEVDGTCLIEMLKTGYRMKCPVNCSTELYDIMQSCWKENPSDRPSFKELHEKVDELLQIYTLKEYTFLKTSE